MEGGRAGREGWKEIDRNRESRTQTPERERERDREGGEKIKKRKNERTKEKKEGKKHTAEHAQCPILPHFLLSVSTESGRRQSRLFDSMINWASLKPSP